MYTEVFLIARPKVRVIVGLWIWGINSSLTPTHPSPIIFGVIETLCCCSRPWAQKFTKIKSVYEDVGMTRDKSQTYFTTQCNFANPYFWNGFVCGRLENWCVSDEATPTFFVLPLSNKHFGHWFLFGAKKHEKNWTYPRNFNKKCLFTRANYRLEWKKIFTCTTFSPFTFTYNHKICRKLE